MAKFGWVPIRNENTTSLVMVGGVDGSGRSEVVRATSDGEEFDPVAWLPEPIEAHCAIAVGPNKIMVVGGVAGKNNKNTEMVAIVDLRTGRWTTPDSLSIVRRSPGCGLVRSPLPDFVVAASNEGDHVTEVVVAGGYNDKDGWLDTVEIYSLENGRWRQGDQNQFKTDLIERF